MPKHGANQRGRHRNCTAIGQAAGFGAWLGFGDSTSNLDIHMPNSTPEPAALFTQKALIAALGGMSERKFNSLRAEGIVPDPLELGPRAPRWTHEDYLEILRRLPRRPLRQEPTTLAEGRRERIEKLKSGNSAAGR